MFSKENHKSIRNLETKSFTIGNVVIWMKDRFLFNKKLCKYFSSHLEVVE